MANQRADNKVRTQLYLDKKIKEEFKELAEQNETSMSEVLLQAIQNYIKSNGSSLESK